MTATPDASAAPPLFSLRLVAGLIVAGILAFAAFLVLAAYAGDFRSGRDGRPHALSVSAVGFKGLVNLVEYSGGTADYVRSDDDLDDVNLLVVAIEPRTDADEVAELLERRENKATLLILPKWEVAPHQTRPGWVHQAGFIFPQEIGNALGKNRPLTIRRATSRRGPAFGRAWLSELSTPAPIHSQTVSGPFQPLLVAAGAGPLLVQIPGNPHYVLADPDLMNNQGLKDPRTAATAIAMLRRLNSEEDAPVSFDLTLNGFGQQRNALKLAFEPPFLALTLALFVAAILGGLHGAFRFGPERREERAIAFGKAALVENSAGLVRLAGREHRQGGAYAELLAEEAARVSGAPASLRGAELEAYLDRLSPAEATPYSSLAARARMAGNRDELVSAARALNLWKKDLIR
jgi:hypothetical protein